MTARIPSSPAPLVRLIDDDPGVLKAQTAFLEMADVKVASYESADEFLVKDDFSIPGCVVLDIRMPGMTGLELQDEMIRKKIDLPIIFLSAHGDIQMAVEAVQKGALDFLVKPPELEKLLENIERGIERNLRHRELLAWHSQLSESWNTLTDKQQEIARLAAKGLPNSLIAEVTGLTERTVRTYRSQIFELLDVINAAELATFLHELSDLEREI